MQRINMKLFKVIICLVLSLGIPLVACGQVLAISGSSFKAGRVIDDAVFYNYSSMSVEQVQNFLNAKLPACDNWGNKPYNGTTRRAYWEPRGIVFPLTCLKDYKENPSTGQNNLEGRSNPSGGKTAAELIWDAGQRYGINPQVLIAIIEREQALIRDDWPWPIQFKHATGYNCPDSGPNHSIECNGYEGFATQVYAAAWQLRRYATHPNDYGYIAGRNNNIQWSPQPSCGSSSIFIENQATAASYIYAPYRPNQAALDNLYGGGDSCSSYAVRNFWRDFNDWFGSSLFSSSQNIKSIKKSSFGSAQQVFAATDAQIYNQAWWPGSGGIYRDVAVKVPTGEVIVGFDKINNPDGVTQTIYTATSAGIYETTWNGSGYSELKKLVTHPGIKKIVADVKNEGGIDTYRLYVLANDGPYEYWWRSGDTISQPFRFWNINNGLDIIKSVDPDGKDEIFVATPSSVYRMKWPEGSDIQRTVVNNIVSTVGIDKQTLPNRVELLYTITQTGVHETWWKDNSGFSDNAKLVDLAGHPQVVDAKKSINGNYHQLYVATKNAAYEYWWLPGQPISSGRLVGRDSIIGLEKSTDGGFQNLYTASPTAIYETWWGQGYLSTGSIVKFE